MSAFDTIGRAFRFLSKSELWTDPRDVEAFSLENPTTLRVDLTTEGDVSTTRTFFVVHECCGGVPVMRLFYIRNGSVRAYVAYQWRDLNEAGTNQGYKLASYWPIRITDLERGCVPPPIDLFDVDALDIEIPEDIPFGTAVLEGPCDPPECDGTSAWVGRLHIPFAPLGEPLYADSEEELLIGLASTLAPWDLVLEDGIATVGPPDNGSYVYSLLECGDFCSNREPGWYVIFTIADGSLIQQSLALAGATWEPEVVLYVSPPIFSPSGEAIETATEWIIAQAIDAIAGWLAEKGVGAIASRVKNPLVLVGLFVIAGIVDSLGFEVSFCPGEPNEPLPVPGDCPTCTSSPTPISFRRPTGAPLPSSTEEWDLYRLCWTVERRQYFGINEVRVSCPPPCPSSYFVPTAESAPVITIISKSATVQVPKGAAPPTPSFVNDSRVVEDNNGVIRENSVFFKVPVATPQGPRVLQTTFGGYDPVFENVIAGTGGTYEFAKACGSSPAFGCSVPVTYATKSRFEFELKSWYYSDASTCVPPAPPGPCKMVIILRRWLSDFDPIRTMADFLSNAPTDLVTVEVEVDSCPSPTPALYFSGRSGGAPGDWFLDVGVPTTGVVSAQQGSWIPPGTRPVDVPVGPAGFIPLPAQAQGFRVSYAIISSECICQQP